MTRVRVDHSFKHKARYNSVECDGPVIDADLDPLKIGKGPAEAIADAVERGIATNPNKAKSGRRRWVRTGHLSKSITAVPSGNGYDIIPPPDRLQTPELIAQLAEDIPIVNDPTADPQVQKAIADAATAILKVR